MNDVLRLLSDSYPDRQSLVDSIAWHRARQNQLDTLEQRAANEADLANLLRVAMCRNYDLSEA